MCTFYGAVPSFVMLFIWAVGLAHTACVSAVNYSSQMVVADTGDLKTNAGPNYTAVVCGD